MSNRAENSTPTGSKPLVGRPFQKGQSGNPGGRPKGIVNVVKAIVGEDGKKVADLLWLLASGTDAAIKKKFGSRYGPRYEVRVECLKELRNMGFGVPKQTLEHSGPDGGPIVAELTNAKQSVASMLGRLAQSIGTRAVAGGSDGR